MTNKEMLRYIQGGLEMMIAVFECSGESDEYDGVCSELRLYTNTIDDIIKRKDSDSDE